MARKSRNRRHQRQLQLEKHRPQILAQKAEAESKYRHAHAHGQSLSPHFSKWEPPVQRIMEQLCPGGHAPDDALMTDDGWHCDQTAMFDLSPADCTMILEKHLYTNQRPIDEQHVIELAVNIKEAIDVSFGLTADDWPLLVNGQHTLEAIILKDKTIRGRVAIYQCRDQAGMAMLFKSFDDNKRRTKVQVVKAAIESNALISPLGSTKLAFWAQKALPGMYGFTRTRIPKTNSSWVAICGRPDVQQFASFMERMSEGVPDTLVKVIVPQGVGGAFYAMFMSHKEKAAKFIKPYLQGEEHGVGLLPHDPRSRLRTFLVMQSGKKGRHNDKLIPELASRTYWSWKKWCEGAPVKASTPRDPFKGDGKSIPDPRNWKIEVAA